MQLTKDDIKTISFRDVKYLDFSKFQQVVDFIEKHPWSETLKKDNPELYKKWMEYFEKENLEDDDQIQGIYLRWLFNYCFVDGLK